LEFFAYLDNWAEKSNSGLVTLRGNAYDGEEAVMAIGKDPWGYPTGGEERDYGDFLTGAREANLAVLERFQHDFSPAPRRSQ
jgi:hypothetical protein